MVNPRGAPLERNQRTRHLALVESIVLGSLAAPCDDPCGFDAGLVAISGCEGADRRVLAPAAANIWLLGASSAVSNGHFPSRFRFM